ncbi:MAG: TerB family tellurite resistance protein [Bacteroidales bacterium]|nr:TerB family tellurite resistance protein [Bacteroidales bacterium]
MFRLAGIIIGAITGGLGGAVLGYIIGMVVDSLLRPTVKVHTRVYNRQDFTESLLILSSAVIKADGHFKRSELYYLRDFLMNALGPSRTEDALHRLQEIMKNDYNIQSVCATLRTESSIHERLLIVQYLFGLANADGFLHPDEISMIRNISMWMGVAPGDYESIKHMFMGSTSGQAGGGYRSSGYTSKAEELSNDYKILEISQDATDDEVKKAYRALAKKHHPDRVAHLGEEMRKAAEEKFARLSQAYDNIRKARGMK